MNKTISDDALSDRMTTFVLKAPTDKKKESVLRESTIPLIGKSYDPLMTVTESDLPEGFVQKLVTATSGKGFRPDEKIAQEKINKIRLQRLRALQPDDEA